MRAPAVAFYLERGLIKEYDAPFTLNSIKQPPQKAELDNKCAETGIICRFYEEFAWLAVEKTYLCRANLKHKVRFWCAPTIFYIFYEQYKR